MEVKGETYKIKEVIEALLYFAGLQDIETKIMKAFYLLESEYYDKTGKRLTSAEFKYHFFGPYSEAVLNTMKSDSNIIFNIQTGMSGNEYTLFKLKDPFAVSETISKFDPVTRSLIEKWAKVMQNSTYDEIVQTAYKDKNFTKTEKGEVIKFDSEFLKRKEALKKRVGAKFTGRKLTKDEAETLEKEDSLWVLKRRPPTRRVKELFGSWFEALVAAKVLDDDAQRMSRGKIGEKGIVVDYHFDFFNMTYDNAIGSYSLDEHKYLWKKHIKGNPVIGKDLGGNSCQ